MNKLPKYLVWGFIIFSFIGFLDATYLTSQHFLGTEVKCIITTGCEEVTNSKYSVVFGVPLALLGALYYLTVLVLSLAYADTQAKKIMVLMPFLTATGFLASVYLVYLQLFVIDAICFYCMMSAGTSTLLFILGIITLKQVKPLKNPKSQERSLAQDEEEEEEDEV